jgi:hypothetical protein
LRDSEEAQDTFGDASNHFVHEPKSRGNEHFSISVSSPVLVKDLLIVGDLPVAEQFAGRAIVPDFARRIPRLPVEEIPES